MRDVLAARPLIDDIDGADFEKVILARDGTPGHKTDTINRARKVITGCGFKTIGDMKKDKVEVWLGDLLQELPRVGRQAFQVPTLALGVDRVEGE